MYGHHERVLSWITTTFSCTIHRLLWSNEYLFSSWIQWISMGSRCSSHPLKISSNVPSFHEEAKSNLSYQNNSGPIDVYDFTKTISFFVVPGYSLHYFNVRGMHVIKQSNFSFSSVQQIVGLFQGWVKWFVTSCTTSAWTSKMLSTIKIPGLLLNPKL